MRQNICLVILVLLFSVGLVTEAAQDNYVFIPLVAYRVSRDTAIIVPTLTTSPALTLTLTPTLTATPTITPTITPTVAPTFTPTPMVRLLDNHSFYTVSEDRARIVGEVENLTDMTVGRVDVTGKIYNGLGEVIGEDRERISQIPPRARGCFWMHINDLAGVYDHYDLEITAGGIPVNRIPELEVDLTPVPRLYDWPGAYDFQAVVRNTEKDLAVYNAYLIVSMYRARDGRIGLCDHLGGSDESLWGQILEPGEQYVVGTDSVHGMPMEDYYWEVSPRGDFLEVNVDKEMP